MSLLVLISFLLVPNLIKNKKFNFCNLIVKQSKTFLNNSLKSDDSSDYNESGGYDYRYKIIPKVSSEGSKNESYSRKMINTMHSIDNTLEEDDTVNFRKQIFQHSMLKYLLDIKKSGGLKTLEYLETKLGKKYYSYLKDEIDPLNESFSVNDFGMFDDLVKDFHSDIF